MSSRCQQSDAFHKGDWKYCPWCGSELAPKKPKKVYGVCQFCGGPAQHRWATVCEPCWWPRRAERYLGGHTLSDLVTLYSSGASWKDIALAFGLPSPQRGPSDVHFGALLFYDLAGQPGRPPAPGVAHTCTNRRCYCPPWVAWRVERDRALDAWLRSQAPLEGGE